MILSTARYRSPYRPDFHSHPVLGIAVSRHDQPTLLIELSQKWLRKWITTSVTDVSEAGVRSGGGMSGVLVLREEHCDECPIRRVPAPDLPL